MSIERLIHSTKNLKTKLLLEGLIVGVLAGSIAIIYRLLLSNSEKILFFMIDYIKGNALYIIAWFVFLLVIGYIISKFLEYESFISGSGIPQVEAEVQGYIEPCWYKVIISKMIAGTLAVMGGLSLGREGPSIQLGAMIAKGFSRVFNRIKIEEKFLLTCGGAAGLAAAFNAPFAGIMFALEEVHKNFSTSALVSVMCASITGDFISKNVFGLQPAFHFHVENTLPLNEYGWILVLAVMTGLLGVFYNYATAFVQDMYERIPFLKAHQRIFIPLLLSGIIALTLPQILGGGHAIIDVLNEGQLTISYLILLLVCKFAFSLLSFGSGAPGGIFFPLLVLGSLIGSICGGLFVEWGSIDSSFLNNFIILAMAGYFAAIVRAPITGIVLIAEMSGTLTQLLPLALVSFISYIVADLLHSEPIYESLLKRLLRKNQVPIDHEEIDKILLSFVVEMGSIVEGQIVSNIYWPRDCLLVSIKRGNSEMIPNGDTNLKLGDQVVIVMDSVTSKEQRNYLLDLFTGLQ